MKRIFLIVGLAFGCSSVYAQIVQVGDGNSSTILSNTTNPASNIKVLQLYGNRASGTQGPDLNAPGNELQITLRQRNIGAVAPALYNFFEIMQQGTTNEITGDQIGFRNGARLTQGGTLTQSLIETSQSGSSNAIIINQQNGVDYRATVRQGPVIPGGALDNPPVGGLLTNTTKNTVVLDQIGQSGTADIVQAGSFSRFGGVQKGGTPFQPNTMTISMDNLSAIDVDQDGVGNNIRIVQNGWQYARVTQGAETVRNSAVILQGANRLQDTKNTAIITQNTGDGNDAFVDQDDSNAEKNDTRIVQNGSSAGAGNNSEIDVIQTGKSGRAILTQTGTSRGSQITVDQSASVVGFGSYAEVTQGGQDNDFDVDQIGSLHIVNGTQEGQENETDVDQEGRNNVATVNQDGSNNEIDINQENEPSSGVGNKATAIQGAPSSDSDITIDQNTGDGDENVATVNQTRGDRNEAIVDQYEKNTATVTQSGTEYDNPVGGLNTFSLVDIDQTESVGGTATVVQMDGTFANQVLIEQDEVGNVATVTQTKGRLNSTDIFQDDDNNTATVVQGGNEDGTTTSDINTIEIDQLGMGATATVTQMNNTNGSTVEIDQENSDVAEVMQMNGEDLTVIIEQQDANLGLGNVAKTSQQGEDNLIDIFQDGQQNMVVGPNGVALQSGIDNEAILNQDGSNNMISMDQSGSDNDINIEQDTEEFDAVGNQATVVQGTSTSDSDITILQGTATDGDRNVATVRQLFGDNNDATVSQDAGNTATVTQSGSEHEPSGTGSTVNIDQSNSTDGTATATQALGTLGGTINITQVEEDNTATVNQTNGRLNVATVNQTDDGNTATVNQSGTQDGPGGATSTVTINQDGKDAMATVTQAANGSTVDVNQQNADMAEVIQRIGGATNSVVIDQAGTLAGGGNKAKVDQGGDDNVFNVTQTSVDGADGNVVEGTIGAGDFAMQKGQGNTATVTQDGPINHAAVMQDGEQNTITIDQESEAASGVGNNATAMQGANTSDNDITINQAVSNGGGNTAVVNQTKGDNNGAIVNQLKGNMATITQSGDDADVLGVPSTAIIEQSTSTGGTATILQADGTLGNGALITQTDINNVATINQLAGIVNQAASIQIGERNTSTINQSGSFNVLTFTPSNVAVAQTGNDNTATATQAVGTQAGQIAILQIPLLGSPSVNGNVATVNQNAGTGNLAAITQNDDLNTATITQTGTTDAGSGDPSAVAIVQGGKGGTVTVTQAADGSNVLATQFNGNRNMQTIDQADLGRQLDAITFQNGDDNTLRINQSGQENVSSIVQSNLLLPADPANGPSMHTATLTQGGTVNEAVIGQGGLKNTATLTQTGGEESFASVLQYGSDNMATANQTSSQRNNTLNVTQGRVAGPVPAARATRNAGTLTGALLTLAPGDVVQSEDNVALVNQTTGENQVINLIQSGDNEQATISQAGSDNNNRTVQAGEVDRLFHTQTGSQGRIIASQYGEETDKGNTQTITQSGNNNTVDVGQIKFFNVATITQSGQDNNLVAGSTVRQIGESNEIILNQTGRRGNIAVSQGNAAGLTFGGQTLASTGYDPTTNDAFRNTSGINQAGLDNAIGVVQQGDDGTATVNQEGNDNSIGIRQLNPGAGILRAVFNVAIATQTAGVSNSLIDIEQFGRRNNGSATQSGTGVNNTINLNQRNDDNTATLSQNQGNQNVINVNQNPDAGKIGGNVEIAQSGQDNKARLTQTGYENELTLTQTGDRNVLQQNGGNPFALQGGNNNTATLSQTGQDHTINLNQSGMNNTIMVTQSNL